MQIVTRRYIGYILMVIYWALVLGHFVIIKKCSFGAINCVLCDYLTFALEKIGNPMLKISKDFVIILQEVLVKSHLFCFHIISWYKNNSRRHIWIIINRWFLIRILLLTFLIIQIFITFWMTNFNIANEILLLIKKYWLICLFIKIVPQKCST